MSSFGINFKLEINLKPCHYDKTQALNYSKIDILKVEVFGVFYHVQTAHLASFKHFRIQECAKMRQDKVALCLIQIIFLKSQKVKDEKIFKKKASFL